MVEFSTARINPSARRTDCLVVGVYDRNAMTPSARQVEEATEGAIGQMLADGDLPPVAGSTALVHRPQGVAAKRVLLVRLGARSALDDRAFRRAAGAAARAVAGTGSRGAADCLGEAEVEGRDEAWRVRAIAEAYGDAAYRFRECKSDEDETSVPRLRRVAVHSTGGGGAGRAAARRALAEATAINGGKRLARDLGNRPRKRVHAIPSRRMRARPRGGVRLHVRRGPRRRTDARARHGRTARGRRREPAAAEAHRPRVRRGRSGRSPRRARRKGRDVRLRRNLHQAGRGHGRNEVRHVRARRACSGRRGRPRSLLFPST